MIEKDLTNQEKLEEIYKMTVENHSVLVSLRNQQRLANVMRIIYWLVIIGAFAGVFYYLSPAIDMITSNKDKANNAFQQFNDLRQSLPETKAIDSLLKSIKSSSTTQ